MSAILKNAKSFNSQNTANTLWACALLALQWRDFSQETQQALINAIHRNANKFNRQEIANILWAGAILGISLSDIKQICFPSHHWKMFIEHLDEKSVHQLCFAQATYSEILYIDITCMMGNRKYAIEVSRGRTCY